MKKYSTPTSFGKSSYSQNSSFLFFVNSSFLLIFIFDFGFSICHCSIVINQAFQNVAKHEFGLDEEGNKHCMVLKFETAIFNLNLRDKMAIESLDFSNKTVKLIGFCSKRNEVQKHSQLQASWRMGERRKALKFVFREKPMKSSSAQVEELRWQLESLEFAEKFKGRSVKFSSVENVTLAVNAPLNQKFVCRDAINLTLRNPRYKDVVVQLQPVANNQIELQPVATSFGLGNNVFICERTRRKTLRESFQNRMTVFSGILLGMGSVGMIVGYSVWKQMPAQRDSGERNQRRRQYANIE